MPEHMHTSDAPIESAYAIPAEVEAIIREHALRQHGSITEEEFAQALASGWDYGIGLINGYKPEHSVISGMARTICGLGASAINTLHYVPVQTVIHESALAAKRSLRDQTTASADTAHSI